MTAYVDDEVASLVLVVEADRASDEPAFFADVTAKPRPDALRSTVELAGIPPK